MNSFLSSRYRTARVRRSSTFELFNSVSDTRRNTFRQPPSKRREPKRIWQILYSMFF
jgi:hypothetical protein